MRTKYRSIGAVVLVATTMILAACIPPPSGTPRPRLTLPDDIEVVATSEDGAIVTFEATATYEGESVPVVCDPASASLFPTGATTVRCTATAFDGASRSGSFTVTVLPEGTTTTTTAPTSTTSTTSTSTTTTTTTTTSTTTTAPGPTTTLPSGDGPPALSAGGAHTCAVRDDATLACWGYNLQGQVGDGSFNLNDPTVPLPSTVPGLANVTDVDAGFRHTCALRNDGQVFCWGLGNSGQLGNGGTQTQRTPAAVSNMANAIDVAAGDLHSCAVRNDGSVACWGDGFSGALGGSTNDSLVPRTVPGVTTAVSVSAAFGHTCALLADGSAVCWGSNNNGQLGNGETTTSLMPVAVQLSNISEISTGSGYTCATSNGSAYCWGGNVYGQLGEGTLENSVSTPLLVPNLTAAGIAAGDDHVCTRLAADGVRCFGRNDRGQLGNGTFNDSLIRSGSDGEPIGYRTPVDVAGLSSVAAVVTGGEHSCARRLDGSIACWGDNKDRQLGSGGTSQRYNTIREVTGL